MGEAGAHPVPGGAKALAPFCVCMGERCDIRFSVALSTDLSCRSEVQKMLAVTRSWAAAGNLTGGRR